MSPEHRDLPDTLEAGMALLDSVDALALYCDSHGAALRANEAWSVVFGPPSDGPWAWLERTLPESRARVRRVLESALRSGARVETDLELRAADGAILEYAVVGGVHREGSGPDGGMLVMAWDITERRRHEERLAFIAGHDALTGLPNRRTFIEALGRAVSRASRGAPAVLLMIDIDNLKSYNDTLGHPAGDQALVNLAMLIRRHVRAADVPARIGGDEFAVILDGADIDEAYAIAERMRASVAEGGFVPAARAHSLGLSGGLVAITAGSDSKTLMSQADAALYAAKAAGRDRMVMWDAILGAEGEGPVRLQNMIERAFDEDGFDLMFQPVIRLGDGSVAYFESLVRLTAADGTVFGPREFLPLVEGAGRMSQLTRRTVERVLSELARIPGCAVSVNLSASDLSDRELLESLEATVGASGLGGRLVFELSESTLLAALPQGRAWMRRLGDAGCSFVLDEFGNGAGMFSLIREERIGQVKLSRTAVRELSAEAGMRAFVVAMRELIESQGKVAVATFLETEQLLGEVRRAGFTVGQGYGLHEPESDLRRLVDEFAGEPS